MIYIGSDHAGLEAKNKIIKLLNELKKEKRFSQLEYKDLGTYTKESVDYPKIAKKVCTKISNDIKKGKDTTGILICGSGTGMVIAANRFSNIRASLAYDKYSAIMAKKDNNANVLTLRAREFNHNKYKTILKAWLTTEFSNEPRHKRRINQLSKL